MVQMNGRKWCTSLRTGTGSFHVQKQKNVSISEAKHFDPSPNKAMHGDSGYTYEAAKQLCGYSSWPNKKHLVYIRMYKMYIRIKIQGKAGVEQINTRCRRKAQFYLSHFRGSVCFLHRYLHHVYNRRCVERIQKSFSFYVWEFPRGYP